MSKKVLLIAGGGTLGTYTSEELLKMGCSVDVICLEDKESSDERLRFFKEYATEEYLNCLFEKTHYDVIVNFIHYSNVEEYKKIHSLLINNTEHLVFLSSYRVYADEEHPITETSPRLSEVLTDEEFFQKETYALPKSRCEDLLNNDCAGQAWTIVRPVISFSDMRMDVYTYSGHTVLEKAKQAEELLLPDFAQNLTAGLDWAGNSGKLIARLAVNPETIGKCYTISSGQNLTWGEVADIYKELIGLKVRWVDENEYIKMVRDKWGYIYDRKFNRVIDASEALSAAGLRKEDFTPIYEGVKIELTKLGF